jgi:hypothetical protein
LFVMRLMSLFNFFYIVILATELRCAWCGWYGCGDADRT